MGDYRCQECDRKLIEVICPECEGHPESFFGPYTLIECKQQKECEEHDSDYCEYDCEEKPTQKYQYCKYCSNEGKIFTCRSKKCLRHGIPLNPYNGGVIHRCEECGLIKFWGTCKMPNHSECKHSTNINEEEWLCENSGCLSERTKKLAAKEKEIHEKFVYSLGSISYQEYLRSSHWQTIRELKLAKGKNECEVCGSNSQLQMHHKTYKRRGKELPEDLVILCKPCHQKFHGRPF